jgi:hypothetical protein
MGTSQNAQLWRTDWLNADPLSFRAQLHKEIGNHEKNAERKGMVAAVRLNGSSDRPPFHTWHIARLFPGVRFYDYTKAPFYVKWVRKYATVEGHAKVHLTLSWTEKTTDDCHAYLEQGGNVAVVGAPGLERPKAWYGYPTIDGDEYDARFLDPPGTVAWLAWKGGAKHCPTPQEGETEFVARQRIPILEEKVSW